MELRAAHACAGSNAPLANTVDACRGGICRAHVSGHAPATNLETEPARRRERTPAELGRDGIDGQIKRRSQPWVVTASLTEVRAAGDCPLAATHARPGGTEQRPAHAVATERPGAFWRGHNPCSAARPSLRRSARPQDFRSKPIVHAHMMSQISPRVEMRRVRVTPQPPRSCIRK